MITSWQSPLCTLSASPQAAPCKARSLIDGRPCGTCTACTALSCLCLEVNTISSSSSDTGSEVCFTYLHQGIERNSQERKLRCQRSSAHTLVSSLGLRDVRLLMDLVQIDHTREFVVVLSIPSQIISPFLEPSNPEKEDEDEAQQPSGLFLWSVIPHLSSMDNSDGYKDPTIHPHAEGEGSIRRRCGLDTCRLSEVAFGPHSGLRLLRCQGHRPDTFSGATSPDHCATLYCTTEHQRMDWMAHKGYCGIQSSGIV